MAVVEHGDPAGLPVFLYHGTRPAAWDTGSPIDPAASAERA